MEKTMKKGLQCFVTVISLFFGMPAYSGTANEVLNAVSPSLVMIQADNIKNNIRNKGSGVVVDTDLVATNCHVIEDADEIWVIYKGKEYPAKVQHADWDRDVCTLYVRGTYARAVVMGNTNSLKEGSGIYAVKTRASLQLTTLDEGVILGIRSVDGGKFLQISTPVLPGLSGGGLFDQKGRLIGLMSYYLDMGDRKLYYALPVEWINELPWRQHKISKASEIKLRDLLKKSVELEEKEDWDGLLKHSLLWTELQPQAYAAWFNLGNAYAKSGQYDKAIESFKQALSINSDYPEAWFNLGITYNTVGQYTESIDALKKTVDMDSENISAWVNLGINYYQVGQRSHVKKVYKVLKKLDPSTAKEFQKLFISQ
jgi:tetratricopeptide (TPR) repeat protein